MTTVNFYRFYHRYSASGGTFLHNPAAHTAYQLDNLKITVQKGKTGAFLPLFVTQFAIWRYYPPERSFYCSKHFKKKSRNWKPFIRSFLKLLKSRLKEICVVPPAKVTTNITPTKHTWGENKKYLRHQLARRDYCINRAGVLPIFAYWGLFFTIIVYKSNYIYYILL